MIIDTLTFQALTFEVETLREDKKRFGDLAKDIKRMAVLLHHLLAVCTRHPGRAVHVSQALHLGRRLDSLTAALTARTVDWHTMDVTAAAAYKAGVADAQDRAAGRVRGGRHARPRGGRTAQLRLVEGGLR